MDASVSEVVLVCAKGCWARNRNAVQRGAAVQMCAVQSVLGSCFSPWFLINVVSPLAGRIHRAAFQERQEELGGLCMRLFRVRCGFRNASENPCSKALRSYEQNSPPPEQPIIQHTKLLAGSQLAGDDDYDLVEELLVSYAAGEAGSICFAKTEGISRVRFKLYVLYIVAKAESAKRVVRLATVASNLMRKHGLLVEFITFCLRCSSIGVLYNCMCWVFGSD